MNKGTLEGTKEEINFVKELNKNKDSKYWKILQLKGDNCFAIHVTSHKFGKVNSSKIKPKADLFLAKGTVDLRKLKNKKFYLDETDLQHFKLKPLLHTGISIKRIDSYKYQILKMNPSTFKKIFGNYELGAGASIYCKRKEELKKNDSVLKGWKTDWERFLKFFKIKDRPKIDICNRIKKEATKEIYKIINQNKTISDFIFKGVGNFKEPYTATWFYEKGILKKARKIPFVVTTGSGRSRGDFTIVIKPK